ncbi:MULTISPECIES: FMN-dependent NADH-azoreductase [unclassified Pseudomonas]|uniref:FMN-dependent NADH-azoreductase n=1 Tax=unclassified Pseudomonas TaxID=196821 RepID=UPI000BDD9D7D|nr:MULTISPECIES: FMN-dependent NADH-azoreductase [unclassified Pseudomonas]PVZ19491.1 FMN-dependent NADH-azoreductase [Pseudomonas sp. URIL14HWK12:I12]PVZ22924.1 FMN-dependent NADH-azoreductase [Pseudomonas sp. URIL14HWK12:I10]PVZ37446.1 FMN-dependent NADH-azoreductase [Pseudomonas sp. URIL14HWK12:I11]SNZ14808.1 FMN-dependent NADH-azoreductase [Pseudomonas sp. URIL14HWK12:I9]
MKLLHIDSSILGDHSASRSLTHALVSAWQAAEPGIDVTYRDLAHSALGHFSAASLQAAGTPAEQRSAEQQQEAGLNSAALEEFLAADTVVIGAPMYNFTIPTQLKAWLDRVAVAGVTFRYTENGPQGLCGGKKVVIIATAGGKHAGQASGAAHVDYLKLMLGFLGITDIQVIHAEGLAMGDAQREQALAGAQAQINQQFAAA